MAELTDAQTKALYDAWLRNDTNRGLEWLLPVVATVIREHVTAALDEIEKRITSSVPVHFALRHDGTEDPQSAAYVEGLHDAHVLIRDYRQEQDR